MGRGGKVMRRRRKEIGERNKTRNDGDGKERGGRPVMGKCRVIENGKLYDMDQDIENQVTKKS